MADSGVEPESMFMQKGDNKEHRPVRPSSSPAPRRNSVLKTNIAVPPEIITVKDFFDFMKTAYQVYEHLEGDEEEGSKINWEALTKLTVINHVIEQAERDLLAETALAEPKPVISKSFTVFENQDKDKDNEKIVEKRKSCSQLEGSDRRSSLPPEVRVEMLGVWTEANLNCKLNDVINEGILDSILPYLHGYKKLSKTSSAYSPAVKKATSSNTDIKKPTSFGGFMNEKDSRDRLGRRKSSVLAANEQMIQNQKQEGDVEIHVCDEVKGLKKDFHCPQKLLVSKMGYFADVTAGQRLEDMDISVHCDIQIFDWLMRWVKRDTILVADWPLLDPHNVVPILVSASFLQMEPLLHDCLIYCHAHMSEIVKTSTNLACLSDALLTRLAAMYTNAELEIVRDRKDKIQSRLFCKMILSLGEPVPETLRGHYSSLATLFKCLKCNKLLGREIAEQVPCQPSSMRIDRRGNVVSSHSKDACWNLNDYISWLFGELRSWRRVYWRLWADCHFLRCQLCDCYFPVYQMEWCSHHAEPPHMFALEGRVALPAGRYPCCGERAYRYETLTRNTGCMFREHAPEEQLPSDAAVMEIYSQFRDMIAMRPPQLVFPERLTRLMPREPSEDGNGRLQCKEVFWWEGIQLAPPRQMLGMLGKLYTSNNKFNPMARPGSPPLGAPSSTQSLANCSSNPSELHLKDKPKKEDSPRTKKGAVGGGDSGSCCDEQTSSSDESEQSSSRSDEDAPLKKLPRPRTTERINNLRRVRVSGRQWAGSLSARSNQDGQRRFEERAARLMRAALARRQAPAAPGAATGPAAPGAATGPAGPGPAPLTLTHTAKNKMPPGGVYARLEADWRERHGGAVLRPRNASSARARPPPNKFK